jgi:hypothetical protein
MILTDNEMPVDKMTSRSNDPTPSFPGPAIDPACDNSLRWPLRPLAATRLPGTNLIKLYYPVVDTQGPVL